MLDHVSITVTDLTRAERFYDAIFTALGVVKVGSDHADGWIGYGERCMRIIRRAAISPSGLDRSRRAHPAVIGVSRRRPGPQ